MNDEDIGETSFFGKAKKPNIPFFAPDLIDPEKFGDQLRRTINIVQHMFPIELEEDEVIIQDDEEGSKSCQNDIGS